MTKRWRWALDFVLVPAVIVRLAFEPHFLSGWVNYSEIGQYVGPINRLFHGGVPYRDSYTLFGPLSIYVPAFLMACFGKTIAVFWAYFHWASILNILVVYAVGCLVCRQRLVRYAVPVVALVETFHPGWSTQWGGFRMGAGLLVVGCLIRYAQCGRRAWLAGAGALTSLAMLYSTDIGLAAGVTTIALLIWVWASHREGGRGIAGGGVLYVVGVLLVLVPFLIYFANRGALWPYLTDVFWGMPRFHLQLLWDRLSSLVAAHGTVPQGPTVITYETLRIFLPAVFYAGFLTYLVAKWRGREVTPQVTIVYVLVIYGILLYGMAFRAIHGMQFQVALPPLIILIAYVLERCVSTLRDAAGNITTGARKGLLPATLSGAILVTSVIYFAMSPKPYYGSLGGWMFCQRHKHSLIPFEAGPQRLSHVTLVPVRCERAGPIMAPWYQAQEMEGITQFLLEHTRPDETIFTFPEHGIFAFFADRPHLSRFDNAVFAWETPARQRELLEALRSHPPRFVVRGKGLSAFAQFALKQREEILPGVCAYLESHYHVVRMFPTVDILERLPEGG